MGQDMAKRLVYNNLVIENDRMWLWDRVHNALFCCKRGENIAERLTSFYRDRENRGMQYSRIAKYKDKIVVAPARANQILFYNLSTQKVSYTDFDLGIWNELGRRFIKFWDIVCLGQYAFLIGFCCPCILRVDMENEIVDACINLYEEKPFTSDIVFFNFGIIEDDLLLVPSGICNEVFEINVNTMSFDKKVLGSNMCGFAAMCKAEENFWLIPRYKGDIVKWNRENNTVQCYPVDLKKFDFSEQTGMGHIVYDGTYLWVFPLSANMIIKINGQSGEITEEQIINKYFNAANYLGYMTKYSFVEIQDKVLHAYSRILGELLCYNIDTGELTAEIYRMAEGDYNKFAVLNALENKEIVGEGEGGFLLNDYIKMVKSSGIETFIW